MLGIRDLWLDLEPGDRQVRDNLAILRPVFANTLDATNLSARESLNEDEIFVPDVVSIVEKLFHATRVDGIDERLERLQSPLSDFLQIPEGIRQR